MPYNKDDFEAANASEYEINAAFYGEFPDDRPYPSLRNRIGSYLSEMKLAAKEIVHFGIRVDEDNGVEHLTLQDELAEFEGVQGLTGEIEDFESKFNEYLQDIHQKKFSARLCNFGKTVLELFKYAPLPGYYFGAQKSQDKD